MFYLNRTAFRGADFDAVGTFVVCWERYYKGVVAVSPTDPQPIDYISELNINADLTEQNVLRLLRWKDPQWLTTPRRNGTPNPQVARVLHQLGALNAFRRKEIDAREFGSIVQNIFRTGIVWQLFLFHISSPWEWPIADQHVFRAYSAIFEASAPNTIAEFEQYRCRFAELAQCLRSQNGVIGAERRAITASNKRLDDALMAYGQFLLAYDR